MYIVVQRTIDLLAAAAYKNDKTQKDGAFKNNASFTSPFKSKANNALVDNTEDLDIFMAMYHLLQYSDNYSMTS